MSFRRPQNPGVVRNEKYRDFDGIGGPAIQVLKRYNDRGWDISNTIFNEITDFSLLEKGSLILRGGSVKINTTGETATVTNLFEITIGNVRAYGVVVNGVLKVITMPSIDVRRNPLVLSNKNVRSGALESIYTSTDPSIRYP